MNIPTGLPPNSPPLEILRAEEAWIDSRIDFLDHRTKGLASEYHAISRALRKLSDEIRSPTPGTTPIQTLQVRDTVLRQVLSEGEEEMFEIMQEVRTLREKTRDIAARLTELKASRTGGKAE